MAAQGLIWKQSLSVIHTQCYSIRKGCDFRGEIGEVSIKIKKKKIQPSGLLEKNPLTYHVNGYNGLRCVMSIEDSDECERSLQTRRKGMSSGEPSVTEAGERW